LVIARAGQLVQVGDHGARYEGELFLARFRIKSMQHSVVSTDKYQRSTILNFGSESSIIAIRFDGFGKIVQILGAFHDHRARVDDIAEQSIATFSETVIFTLDKGQTLLTCIIYEARLRVGMQGKFLILGKIVPVEAR